MVTRQSRKANAETNVSVKVRFNHYYYRIAVLMGGKKYVHLSYDFKWTSNRLRKLVFEKLVVKRGFSFSIEPVFVVGYFK